MEKNKNIRFARIRGRIVPIKVKKGSGSRKPEKIRAARSNKANQYTEKIRSGRNMFLGGNLAMFAGGRIFKSGAKDATKSIDFAKAAIKTGSKSHADTAVKLFKSQRMKFKLGKATALLGLASTLYGAVKLSKNSKKAREEGTKRAIRTKALRRSLKNER